MSLSRRVATSVVDTLKSKGHILVVKGGSEALVRELDALMAQQLTQVSAGVGPRTIVGEVTSTFGDEAIDEAIEEMVGGLAGRLMDSDHVEDVFAEDNVIRRDIFRAVRDALLRPPDADEGADEEPAGPISVRLETLGYVAATVAKRADAETLRDALERAALAFSGELKSYDADGREALFTMPGGDPDVRLELEEAVADELTDLVDMGLVDLPTVERRLEMPRALSQAERAALKPKLDVAVQRAVHRVGFAASWDFVGGSSVLITITPLSEQDAKNGDQYADLAAREANALLGEAAAAPEAAAPSSRRPTATDGAPPSARDVAPVSSSQTKSAAASPPSKSAGAASSRDGAPTSTRAADPKPRPSPPPPSTRRSSEAAPPSEASAKRTATRRAPAKTTPKKKASATEAVPSSRKPRTTSAPKPVKRTAARKKS